MSVFQLVSWLFCLFSTPVFFAYSIITAAFFFYLWSRLPSIKYGFIFGNFSLNLFRAARLFTAILKLTRHTFQNFLIFFNFPHNTASNSNSIQLHYSFCIELLLWIRISFLFSILRTLHLWTAPIKAILYISSVS